MKEYKKVRSTVKPEVIKIDEYSVWVHSNISEVLTEDFQGWEYDMIHYSKDEYMLKLQSDIDFLAIMEGIEI